MRLNLGESGSMVLGTMVYSSVIGLTISICLGQIAALPRASEASSSVTHSRQIADALRFALGQPKLCQRLLTGGLFGPTLDDLQARSRDGSLVIQVNDRSRPDARLQFQSGTEFAGAHIESVRVSETFSRIDPSANGRLGEIQLTLTASSRAARKVVVIPFYVVTDSNGVLTSCSATTYKDPRAHLTVEDDLCQRMSTSAYDPSLLRYEPESHRCLVEI